MSASNMNRVFRCGDEGPCPESFRRRVVIINDGVATAGYIGNLEGKQYLCPLVYEVVSSSDRNAILLEATPLPLFGKAEGIVGNIIPLVPEVTNG